MKNQHLVKFGYQKKIAYPQDLKALKTIIKIKIITKN